MKNLITWIFTHIAILRIGGYITKPKVNGFTIFSMNTYLARDTHFNGMKIRGKGKVEIGNHFHSGQDCLIITSYHDYNNDGDLPYGDCYIHKNVIIEDNVWVGDRVIILGGVVIGEGAIVQAGAVVVRNIAPLAIAGGSPAIQFASRDMANYLSRKANQIK